MTQTAADLRSEIRERVSERTLAWFEDALVWDMTLPWLASYADKDVSLPRFRSAGVDFASLTVNDFPGSLGGSVRRIAEVTRHIQERSDTLALVKSVDGILQAKREGKFALAFNLQETNPLEGGCHHLAGADLALRDEGREIQRIEARIFVHARYSR